LRFSLAFRGYRMAEVDDALDRLATEIAERDARIEQLTGQPYETPPTDPTAAADAPTRTDDTAPIHSDVTAPIADAEHPLDLASSESNDPADPNAAL
jgi:DivIVA domain-containing protein